MFHWRIFYKCVQLVQGEIMLISITINLLFNFEKKKNITYVFLLLRTFKISFPSVFTIYLVLFYREKRRKNLTTNLNKFCLHAVAGFATHCANCRGALHPRSKVWSSTTPLYQNISIKFFVMLFKIYPPLTYVKIEVKKCLSFCKRNGERRLGDF